MKRKRHPIRGFFAGVFVGLGVAILLLIFGKMTTSCWLIGIAIV